MSFGVAPFGTDLQPECTVKVVAGKLVHNPIAPSSRQQAAPSTRTGTSRGNFLQWPTAEGQTELLWSREGPSRSLKANHRRSLTHPLLTSSPTPVARRTNAALPPISEASLSERPAVSVSLRDIASQLKRVHRWSEKVDDVLMFSRGLDRLQSGSITSAELQRLLHCCGLHLQDEGFTALLDASGAGVDKSDGVTSDTLVNCRMFCSFLKGLVSGESHDAAAVAVKQSEEEHGPFGRGLRPGNVERPKRQRVYHSSPARLLVPQSRPHGQPRWMPPVGASEAERGLLSQDTARLLVKVEHTLRDTGWGLDTHFRSLEQALAARDRERTGYLSVEDVSLSITLHILTHNAHTYTHPLTLLNPFSIYVYTYIRNVCTRMCCTNGFIM